MKLSTHGFDLNDTEMLREMLCNRYGEYFGIAREKDVASICAADSASRCFLNEIDLCFPGQMSRKSDCWRKPEARFYENIPNRATDHTTLRKSKLYRRRFGRSA